MRETGRRSWSLRYRPKLGTKRGPQRRVYLGDLGGPLVLDLAGLGLEDFKAPASLTLEGARDVARPLNGLAARGVDPRGVLERRDREREEAATEAQRRAAQGTERFSTLVDRFLKARLGDVRPNTMALWESLARCEVKPSLGDLDPLAMTRKQVREFHHAIGETGRTTWANRSLELVAAVFKWAVSEELVPSSPVVNIEPFGERPRDRVLTSEEIKRVWEAIEIERPWGDALKLLFWTAARKGEVLGMTWAEVDFKAHVWRIPAERSKTNETRTVPLSKGARELLKTKREADPKGRFVFPSPVAAVGALASLSAPHRRIVARSGVTEWTIHDLRRTVRTNLAALGVRRDVAESILGHVLQAMERVYNRYEPLPEMATALESWARRLERIVAGEELAEADNVVSFAR